MIILGYVPSILCVLDQCDSVSVCVCVCMYVCVCVCVCVHACAQDYRQNGALLG